jgi:integration host factor subunit beta
MTKSELIEILTRKQPHLKPDDVDLAVKSLLEMMGGALTRGERIEVRGFGSFSLHYRPPRMGRNPKTGDPVALPAKHVPHFKPGKELRERVSTVAPIEEIGSD